MAGWDKWDKAWLESYQNRGVAATLPPPSSARHRNTEEHDFQTVVIDYLRLVLPPICMVFSIDHANARSALTGALRKRRGVIAGIPDIYLALGSYTLWMECKARDGILKTPQKDFRDKALLNGQDWCAPRTLEDVRAALRRSPIPLRVQVS